jgi:hypothetical protein
MGLRHGGNWGDTENKNCRSNSRRKTVASGGISRLTSILPSAREPLQVANIINWQSSPFGRRPILAPLLFASYSFFSPSFSIPAVPLADKYKYSECLLQAWLAASAVIPFVGQADLFSAIGHRLRNLGVHPSKISASRGLPYWFRPPGRSLNKPLWQGRGRPSITQAGSTQC